MARLHFFTTASLGALALFAGCTVGPDYHRPAVTTPPSWGEIPMGAAAATAPSVATASAATLTAWWSTLGDRHLDSLIARAVESNLDLRLASARLAEARAQRGTVTADQYPSVNTKGSYTRERYSANSPFGAFLPQKEYDEFQAGFDANWEVDLFGRVRRGVEAANADIASAVEDRRDALVSLLAEVARDYVDLRTAQRRLAIAQQNLASQRATLELVQIRRDTGAVGDLDVTRSQAQVRDTEASLPPLRRQARENIHALSVLLGREPNALSAELEAAGPIPVVPPEVPVGAPADLLRRRPDVRRAERQLAAATARIGVATADLYPRLSLTGSFTLDATELSKLGDWSSRAFNVGPTLTWPVFDAGRIRATIHVADARQQQALGHYEQTVLIAFREVEDALVGYATEQSRRAGLAASLESARKSVDLANDQYKAGAVDLLVVLDAQRTQFAAEDLLALSDRAVTTYLVTLYKALGGGWDADPTTFAEKVRSGSVNP